MCRPVYQEYEVPVHYTTCHPVYEQHTCEVPQTCYRTVSEQRQYCYKTCTCEPVYEDKCVKVCTGCYETEQVYCPGPVQHKCCRLPGHCDFDPCTCTSHYCPGETVTYEIQCPGHYECRKVWVPHEEVRTVRCCRYVTHEQVHTGSYTVCHLEPYTVMRQRCWTTCRMVPEDHC